MTTNMSTGVRSAAARRNCHGNSAPGSFAARAPPTVVPISTATQVKSTIVSGDGYHASPGGGSGGGDAMNCITLSK